MRRQFQLLFVIAFILAVQSAAFAQAQNSSMPGAGTRRAFTLFGDLKVDESQAGGANTNVIFDVILYTRGNEVFQRQRVGNNGRYRFNNVFNGDYYLAVELDNVEIALRPELFQSLITTAQVKPARFTTERLTKSKPRTLLKR